MTYCPNCKKLVNVNYLTYYQLKEDIKETICEECNKTIEVEYVKK